MSLTTFLSHLRVAIPSGSYLWYNGIMLKPDHPASEAATSLTPDSSRLVSLLLAKEAVDYLATR
jgi:hypothetical protein